MRIIRADQVESLLDLDALVGALAPAMIDLSSGAASVPPRIAALVKERDAWLGAMPAYCPSAGVLASKLVTVFPGNAGGLRPTHQAVIVVFDPFDGQPLALMDGSYITATRTAAGSALATKLLARTNARSLAILGTGVQAWAHARAIRRVREIATIRIAGRDFAKAAALAQRASRELGLAATPCASWAEAADGADIVCATTHPHDPVVRREWLSPGVHVNSVGISTKGHEIDLETLQAARLFVEQRSAASAPMPTGSNELHAAVSSGAVSIDAVTEIGELLQGRRPGRADENEITLYKSVGVAVQDAAAAGLVLRRAIEQDLGLRVEL